MTKKELEEREIKLEAVIQAYYDLIDKFTDSLPGPVKAMCAVNINNLEEYSRGLFNAAEVREGIEELVDFGIVYEDDMEEQ